jgi:hypothetical protein
LRIESSVTSISWIPSEAIDGMPKVPFELGVTHYDEAPPDRIDDLEALVAADTFREANRLSAWIEVEDGKIVDYGQNGKGYIGTTRMKVGPKAVVVTAVQMPDLRSEEVEEGSVRFVQTAGGRAGFPAPRRVRGKPYFQVRSALAWTTIALRLNADGSSSFELAGASPFPRHWVYDDSGQLVQKSGTIDFKTWYRESFDPNSPWGAEDSAPVVREVETALERELSAAVMQSPPKTRRLGEGEALVEQGEPGEELFLLLDGVLAVEVDGEVVAEIGPGAILGERALLEGGTRSATLRAVTRAKVVPVRPDEIDRDALVELARGHEREAE